MGTQGLAIETSGKTMSVALYGDEGFPVATVTVTSRLQHSRQLMPAIVQLMRLAGWQPKDLTEVAIAEGPGSYTGVRIGGTTAKVLGETLNLPLRAVSSLQVLAKNVSSDFDGVIIPYIDARRKAVFSGAYRYENNSLLPVLNDCYVACDEWISSVKEAVHDEQLLFIGDNQDLFKGQPHLSPTDSLPNAVKLAELAQQVVPIAPKDFEPHYLKRVEAEENWLKEHPDEKTSADDYVAYI
ncbi:tRNA (adenosine(37)-N6)-threonylcarbamoyltransferase complex dimerization subunit type 1 TsaB [Bavariicoccus seileri]|uniref:tRNA (adenosine(37)-N6)-threonylcarbamoyltransferase complex dimerization subunit type 1 TsaB n=1 Tax=Bavariicoccus seileri TaxID=549685 RepID=UPI0003B3740D|nr:tRNA (adenosine(37)-N6)-threonylcarbamoyltransferase complex dimerization subunit type 1 TsaB [Bavariicoccus seileri]